MAFIKMYVSMRSRSSGIFVYTAFRKGCTCLLFKTHSSLRSSSLYFTYEWLYSSCFPTTTFFFPRDRMCKGSKELLWKKFARRKYDRTFLRILENYTHLNLLQYHHYRSSECLLARAFS